MLDIHTKDVYPHGMSKTATITRKRVNITLSNDTLRILDRVVSKGDRSQFIDQAVRTFLTTKRKATLRSLLKEGALARADRDLGLAQEWFDLENEVWPGRKGK